MLRTLLLVVFLSVCASPALADKVENLKDCKFFKTDVVMSKTSGALGNVLSGRLEEGQCYYDIRFHLGGTLTVVKGMRDYELTWPSKESARTQPAAPQRPPEDYTKGLDFGG